MLIQPSCPYQLTTVRSRGISGPLMRAVALLSGGVTSTVTETAARIGVSRQSLRRSLQRPAVQLALRRQIQSNVTAGGAAASARLVALLGHDNGMVSFQSSKLLLGLNGFQPPSQPSTTISVNVMQAGYILDLRPEDAAEASLIRAVPTSTPQIDGSVVEDVDEAG